MRLFPILNEGEPSMKKIEYKELSWNLNPENVSIGFNEKMIFGSRFDVAHAVIAPKESLKKHFHERGEDGQEVFCFYKGGHFRIGLKDSEEVVDTKKPVYVNFSNHEVHGITNLSDKKLEFQVWCSPPFKKDEVTLL